MAFTTDSYQIGVISVIFTCFDVGVEKNMSQVESYQQL